MKKVIFSQFAHKNLNLLDTQRQSSALNVRKYGSLLWSHIVSLNKKFLIQMNGKVYIVT